MIVYKIKKLHPVYSIVILLILSSFKPFTAFKYTSKDIKEYNDYLLAQALANPSSSEKFKKIVAKQNIKVNRDLKELTAEDIDEYKLRQKYNHIYSSFIFVILILYITSGFIKLFIRASNEQ